MNTRGSVSRTEPSLFVALPSRHLLTSTDEGFSCICIGMQLCFFIGSRFARAGFPLSASMYYAVPFSTSRDRDGHQQIGLVPHLSLPVIEPHRPEGFGFWPCPAVTATHIVIHKPRIPTLWFTSKTRPFHTCFLTVDCHLICLVVYILPSVCF